MHHLVKRNTNLGIKLKAFISSNYSYITDFISNTSNGYSYAINFLSKKVKFDV